MPDRSHLHSLEYLRSVAISYHALAKTEKEKEWRAVRIKQLDKEISAEYKFLGIEEPVYDETMALEEIFAEMDALGL